MVRSGTKTPFKPRADMGSINITDTRQDIYNNMITYERRLRKVAMRFGYNAINKLPKVIYDSKIITALNNIRDNAGVSTMVFAPPSKIPTLPSLPNIPDGPVMITPIGDQGITADPLNQLSQGVARGINDRIRNRYNPVLDDIDAGESPIDSDRKDLERILKDITRVNEDMKKVLNDGVDGDESKTVDLDNMLSDQFIDEILRRNGRPINEAERDALEDFLRDSQPFNSINAINTISDEKLKAINKAEKDLRIKSDKQQAEKDAEVKKRDDAAKAKRDFEESKHDRPPDEAKTDQLIPDKGPVKGFLLTLNGTLSRRGIDGSEEIMLMDGSWVPVNFNPILGRRFTIERDRFGQWVMPGRRPPGMSIEDWEVLRKKVTDDNEKRKKDKPIPLPPTTKPIPKDKPPKDEDPPIPPIDPRKKPTTGEDKIDLNSKNRVGGISKLRPFFSNYHGIDLLTMTDQEAMEDIKEYDLFDLPIPENDSLDNPLFVKQVRTQMERFSGVSDPVNATTSETVRKLITSRILASNLDGSITLEREETIVYNVRGIPTQNEIDIQNQYKTPTVLGGLRDGVQFKDPNINDYSRGLGEANRTSASEVQDVMTSLYENPDIYNALIAANRGM